VLFQSAQAELTPTAQSLIERLAQVLQPLNYPIQINGFTDNAPIHSTQYSSNWDLSAARAISVVKRFAAAGVDPSLLVGAGYGQYHPIASNDTTEGRAANRRVSIVAVSPTEGRDILHTPLTGASGNPGDRSGTAARAQAATRAATCDGARSVGDRC
jgi:chemotaxis protein MotB